MRDVVIISDSSRIIIDANQPALLDVFGYETEEGVGKSSATIYADQTQFELAGEEVFNRLDLEAGKLLEMKFRRKSGELFDGEMFALKMRGDDDQPVSNFGVIRDITERKQAEAYRG
jgi:PAS domain S-box-containing protein